MGIITQETRVIGVYDFENIQSDLADLKQMIQQKTQHPYLMKYITEPVIDDDKLLFLYLIYMEAGLSSDDMKEYVLTTMLVQIALDTHETVAVHNDGSDDHTVKNRQLTVLAGDYYSGLYYHLLANLSDIRMISTLASAIKEINEHKIVVYRNETVELASLFHSLASVESALIMRAAEFFGLTEIKEAAYEFFFLKRLLQEHQRLMENVGHSIFQKRQELYHDTPYDKWKHDLLTRVNKSIQQSKQALDTLLEDRPVHQDLLQSNLDELFHLYDARQEKFVEEGS